MKTIVFKDGRKTLKKIHFIHDVVLGSGILLFGILVGIFTTRLDSGIGLGLSLVAGIGSICLLAGMRIKGNLQTKLLDQVHVVSETCGLYYFEGIRYRDVQFSLDKQDVIIILSNEVR